MRKSFGKMRRHGTALVEFALVLPILLLLTLGLVQYGTLFNATNTVSQVTREGGRSAAVNGLKANSDARIRSAVERAAQPTGLAYSDMTVAISPAEGTPERSAGNPITVSVTYDMRKKIFVPSGFLALMGLGNFTSYSRTSTMMLESGA